MVSSKLSKAKNIRSYALPISKEDFTPKAYLVVEHIVTDATRFEEYRVKVGPMIAKHGGRYLIATGTGFLKAGTGNSSASW
jgi:hypothetical protein